MKFRVKLICLLITLCVVSTATPGALAQTTTSGAIEGRVYEEGSNLGIAGAVVTIRNQETGLTRTTATDQSGRYFISTLPPGFYRITAIAQGYVEGLNSAESNFPINITETKRVQPPPISLRKVAVGVPPATPVTPTPVTPTPVRPTTPVTPVPPATQQPQTSAAQQQTSPALPQASSAFEQLVNLTNASRGGSVDRRQLIILPLPGVRTFDDFAFLFAGVAPPPQPIGNSVGPGIGPGVGTTGQFSVNGLRSRSNNFTIDGSDNNDEDVGVRRQGFTSLVPQSIESVQEFQITTLLPEPQFGRNLSAQVNAVSRSGSIAYHGTLYGFFTDKRLRARDAFDFTGGPDRLTLRADGQTVLLNGSPFTVANPLDGENPYTRAQYGFVLGGPISKQKTHFFASFEHQDINASRESHFAVPTVSERGLFGTGGRGLTINGVRTFPTSITGNAFLSLIPFPNNPGGPYGENTYSEVLPADADGNIFSVKLDNNLRAFGKDHNLAIRYNFTDDDTILPVTGEAIFSSLRALVRTQNLALNFDSSISARTANQFRFSYGRTELDFEEVRNSFLSPSALLPNTPFLLNAPLIVNSTLPGSAPSYITFPGTDTESGAGSIPGLAVTGTGPLGQIKVSGYSPIGVDVFNFPQSRTNNTFQYADTLIHNRLDHRFTLGADIRQIRLDSLLDRNFRPLAVFSGAIDVFGLNLPVGRRIPELPGRSGLCVEAACFYLGRDYLAAGAATGFFQALSNGDIDSKIRLRYWQNNFFFVDQYRARPNLTFTFGARYELNTVPKEADRRIESTFNSPEVQTFINLERAAAGVSGFEQILDGRTEIYQRDNNNIAPHIAFAWDPYGDGRTSIRGGYGIYYDQILGAVISQSRNVFPRFLPFNFGGFNVNCDGSDVEACVTQSHPFVAVNPATIFATPGTLNRYDAARRGDPVTNLLAAAFLTNLATGPSFILPSNDLETPYAEHWGLTIERQIRGDMLFSAAYVGTRGVHLLRFATPNLGPNAIPFVSSLNVRTPFPNNEVLRFPELFGISLPPNRGNQLRPFPFLGPVITIESDANSIYHALQLQFNKRFSRGVQFTTAYTWSHAIDEVSDLFDTAGATALPQNSFDRAAERGDANFDVRHRFVYSFIWDLPLWRDDNLLGGWQVASIGTFQTGQPYSVLFCCDVNLDGNLTDRVSQLDAAGLPADPGSAPRNTFRAPGVATVDATVNKVFRFNENRNLEFRTEVFNIFNHTNFGIPVRQLFFAGVGLSPLTNETFVDTRIPARTFQFALKYNF
jgi:hypothetical protein